MANLSPPQVSYRLCPRCLRAVPQESGERFCPNDGSRLLLACPQCNSSITSPYSHYCTHCGHPFHSNHRQTRFKT